MDKIDKSAFPNAFATEKNHTTKMHAEQSNILVSGLKCSSKNNLYNKKSVEKMNENMNLVCKSCIV